MVRNFRPPATEEAFRGGLRAIKTMHLTNSWHATSGGIATFYRALMAAANLRGHCIRLVVPGQSDSVEEIGDFARIYYVKAPPARLNPQYRTMYPRHFMPPNSRVQEILAAERPDLVEICDKYTLNYLGALLRRGLLRNINFRPLVVGLSCERMDDSFQIYFGRLPFSRAFCSGYAKWVYFPFFDHHIANSEYTAEELRLASRGTMVPRNIWILPMGVDLERFSPGRKSPDARRAILQQIGASDHSVLLVYAGRLVPEKNLTLLFELFAHLAKSANRDYRLVVAGDGIDCQRWQEFCNNNAPGRVSFLGHLREPNDLPKLLANADVFVHPNHREPFGIAPLEAMASGLPLVVPNRGGVISYATAGNAWLADPDPESFASSIEVLLANPAEASRRVQNALQTALQYRWEKVTPLFLDLYAELHRAGITSMANAPQPAFSSTPATGLHLAFSRRVSRSAEKIFQLTSELLWRSGS